MKPKILITPNLEDIKFTINENYVKSIQLSGATPILATYVNNYNIDEYLKMSDGVLFSGGDDVNLKFLDEKENFNNNAVPLIRDEFEMQLLKKCIEQDIPTFCICRGTQVLNVVCGGTLFQHIENHMGDKSKLHHKVLIKKDSLLFGAVQDVEMNVNSVHHQAINKVGENLKISSISSDGYIEAIESTKNTFILGVQWHPEYMYESCRHNKAIFKKFVETCNKLKKSKNC